MPFPGRAGVKTMINRGTRGVKHLWWIVLRYIYAAGYDCLYRTARSQATQQWFTRTFDALWILKQMKYIHEIKTMVRNLCSYKISNNCEKKHEKPRDNQISPPPNRLDVGYTQFQFEGNMGAL